MRCTIGYRGSGSAEIATSRQARYAGMRGVDCFRYRGTTPAGLDEFGRVGWIGGKNDR